MTFLYFGYFTVLLILIGSFLVVSTVIFKILGIKIERIYTNIFAKLVLSSTLFVLVVSIYYTNGATILLFLLPLLAFFWYQIQISKIPSLNVKTKIPWQTIVVLLTGACAFFIIRLGQIYSSGPLPYAPHGDIVYYSNCIDFLTYFGKENSSVDYVYGSESGTSPYHYFELWFGAGVSRLFGLNTAISFIIVTSGFSLFVIWLGFCSILEYYKTLNVIDALFCFCLVFLTGLTFTIYRSIPFMDNIFVFSRNAVNYPKLFPIYIFSICALLFFMRKKEVLGLLSLLTLPIVNISTSIGIFAGLFTWYLISYYLTRKIRFKIYFLSMGIVIGIFCFYTFLTTQTGTHVSVSLSDTLYKMGQPAFVKTIFNIHAGTIIQIFLIFMPFLALYIVCIKDFYIKKALLNPFLQLVTLIFLFSLLGWAVLHDRLTTVQVFCNISITLITILSCVILIKVWLLGSGKFTLVNVLVVLFLFVGIKNSFSEYRFKYPQSEAYLTKIRDETQGLSSLGSFIFTAEDYANTQFSYVANFAIQGSYLIYSPNHTFPLSLSPYSYKLSLDPRLEKMEELCLKNTPFWIYVQRQIQKRGFKSITQSQLDFIKEMKINYLICTKKVVLPPQIKSKIRKEIVDQNTGERFYLLNNY